MYGFTSGSLKGQPWVLLLLLALLPLLSRPAFSQVALTNGANNYTQNFDTLITSGNVAWADNTTLPNWYATRSASPPITKIYADGGTSTGNIYSYGTGTGTERALGAVNTGSTGDYAYAVRLKNNGTTNITSFAIAFNGEQWRDANTTAQTVAFGYRVSGSAITSLPTPAADATTPAVPAGYTAAAAFNFTSVVNTGAGAAVNGNTTGRIPVSGTLTVTVPPGSEIMLLWNDPNHPNSDQGLAIDDLSITATYAAAATPSLVASASLLDFGSHPVNTNAISSLTLTAANLTPAAGNLSVGPPPAGFALSLNGSAWTTAALAIPYSGGALAVATPVYVRFNPALAVAYGASLGASGGGATPLAVTLSGWGDPLLTETILPLYIQGVSGTNNDRTPYAFRISLAGLPAAATFRFYNQAVIAGDAPDADGAGNPIFVKAAGDFLRAGSVGMATANQYSTFTTTATGTYGGWFMMEPTGNAKFTPGGQVYMRIMLNDGLGGTAVAHRVTTASPVTVLKYGAAAGDATAVYCTTASGSPFTPKSFVFLYDNTAGAGRPLAGCAIESDGAAAQSSYAAFYRASVEGQNGAWGTLVPNTLAAGIRRVEQRTLAAGDIPASGVTTHADGLWPLAGNTVNPAGGSATPVAFNLFEMAGAPAMSASPAHLDFGSHTIDQNVISSFTLTGSNLAPASGSLTISPPPLCFTFSLDGASWTSTTLAIPYTGGALAPGTVVYVRFTPQQVAPTSGSLTISGGSVQSQTVTLTGGGDPFLTELLLPQYIQGVAGGSAANNERTPYVFRLRLSGMPPHAVFRYYNQVVLATDAATADGSGNPIFVKPGGAFQRAGSVSMATANQYSTFTVAADGSYMGWFMVEPSANSRFTEGNALHMRLMLNDGQGGATVVHRLTTANSVRVIKYGTGSGDATGVYCAAASGTVFVPQNFVFLYDNVAGGRPLAGAVVESDGAAAQSSYVPFYLASVEGQAGAWGTLVPNALAGGIRRVEQRRNPTGRIAPLNAILRPNGIWPQAGNTANPAGGSAHPIVFRFQEVPVELATFSVE